MLWVAGDVILSSAWKYSPVSLLSISSLRKLSFEVTTFRVSTMVNWQSSFSPKNLFYTLFLAETSMNLKVASRRTTRPELSKIRYLPFFRTTRMSSSSRFPMNEVKTTYSLTKASL